MIWDRSRYGAAVFDLDGTVWLSGHPIDGAIEYVADCRRSGMKVAFATNATSHRLDDLTSMLQQCGLAERGDVVVTGSVVLARALLAKGVTEVVATEMPAMSEALNAVGIRVIRADDEPDGWDQPSAQRALVLSATRSATVGAIETIARLAVTAGHPMYVISMDGGFPGLGRMEPGGGMMVAAARALYDVQPITIGKPAPEYAAVIAESLADHGPIVMFGDSQRADIGTAHELGAHGVMVLGPFGTHIRDDLPAPHYVVDFVGAEVKEYQ